MRVLCMDRISLCRRHTVRKSLLFGSHDFNYTSLKHKSHLVKNNKTPQERIAQHLQQPRRTTLP